MIKTIQYNSKIFLLLTLFRRGDGLFGLNCTAGGDGISRAGFGIGSSIFLIGISVLD